MKTRIRIWSAVLCAVLALSLSFTSIPIFASTLDEIEGDYVAYTHVPLEKIADLILTKQGVVAKYEVLQDVCADWATLLVDGFAAVYSNIGGTDTTYDKTAFESEIDAQGITGYKKEIMLETYDEYCKDGDLDWLEGCCSVVECNEFLKKYLVEDGVTKGKTYILNDDVVNDVNKVFQEWVVECEDYYLYRVPAFSEIDTKYFYGACYTFASNFFKARAVPNEPYYIDTTYRVNNYVYSGNLVLGCFENPDYYFYVDGVNNSSLAYPYYDGILGYMSKYGVYDSESIFDYNISHTDAENYSILNLVTSLDYTNTSFNYKRIYASGGTAVKTTYTYQGFVGRNAFVMRLYKDENTEIVYDDENVYYTPDYDTNTNTTFTYTGDYFINTYNTYNYNTVQETINNTENIDNSVVEEIIDNSVTEITNNYNYVEPEVTTPPTSTEEPSGDSGDDSGGDGSGGDSDSSNPFDGVFEKLMDALGNVVGLLDDIVALVLSFVGDALNAIVGMFTSVINLLTAFKDELSGLSGALGEFFPYLPEEFWTIIMASISVICGLAIIRYFMNK